MDKSKINNNIDRYRLKLFLLFDKADFFLEKQSRKKISVFILIVSFLFIYLYNVLHPLFADDWEYSLMPDGHTPITSFRDIYESLYHHYFEWGGRIVVHFIAETLLLINLHAAKILNSLAFLFLMLIMYRITNQKNDIQPSLLLVIGLSLFFLQPAFASTVLWITGSANYLWGTLIIVYFLYYYVKHIFNAKGGNGILKSFILFFVGIIAGWTNENMAVALLFMITIFILYYKIKLGKIPFWAVSGLAGAITGTIFMLIAPGNYIRMNTILVEQIENNRDLPILLAYLKQFLRTIMNYFQYALLPTFIYVVTLYLYNLYGKESSYIPQIKFLSYLFIIAALIATLSMSASPIFPPRAMFGIICLIIMATGILYANLDFSNALIKKLNYIILCFGILFFLTDYTKGFFILKNVNSTMNYRIKTVEQAKKEGITDFIFDTRMENPDRRYVHFSEFSSDPAEWPNDEFSAYYNIRSVIVK